MAANCGWALEYIDNLEMPDVVEMSDYFSVEPPQNWLLKHMAGYKEKQVEENNDHRLFTQTVSQSKPFEQLPRHIQEVIIKASGLPEPEFHRRRQAKRKEELLNARRSHTA